MTGNGCLPALRCSDRYELCPRPCRIEVLAEVLFDAAFPGEREGDPYWFEAYQTDWRANAERFLASGWRVLPPGSTEATP